MIEATHQTKYASSVAQVVAGLDVGDEMTYPVPTGFQPLDPALEGGFRTRELSILGGPPGIGKTSIALQWARHAASTGRATVFACYEHDEVTLLGRLLAQEVGELGGDAPSSHRAQSAVRAVTRGEALLEEELSTDPLLRAAYSSLDIFADRLWLSRASGVDTDLHALEALVDDFGPGTLLFIDYLQKIAGDIDTVSEADRVIRLAEGLKELALDREIAILAIVAGDHSALSARRLRLHHMRGAAGLAYEADVVLMLNEKSLAVSKSHSAFDSVRAQEFTNQIVLSVDKNRGGPAPIDLEFTKDLSHFRLDPHGKVVEERLVDSLLTVE